MGDKRGALDAGARLFRYFDLGPKTRPVLEKLQGMLSNLLNDQQLPLSQAAGVYWEYRDLAPTGGAGDAVASNLADRLADARLFGRAAELLRYQMDNRATDIAKRLIDTNGGELIITPETQGGFSMHIEFPFPYQEVATAPSFMAPSPLRLRSSACSAASAPWWSTVTTGWTRSR